MAFYFIGYPQRATDAEDSLLLGYRIFGGNGEKYFVYLGYKNKSL